MAIESGLIAGRYSGTYGASDLGVQMDGFRLRQQWRMQEIANTDKYGEALIDAIVRLGRCRVATRSATYKTGTIAAIWPFGTFGVGGIVGRLASAIASSLVLSSTVGTPAASSPGSLTGSGIVTPGYEVELLFSSELREVPVVWELLYDGTNFFTTT